MNGATAGTADNEIKNADRSKTIIIGKNAIFL